MVERKGKEIKMIKRLKDSDRANIFRIINEAALAYRGVIPEDCHHQPYMPDAELKQEMDTIDFYGWEENYELVGVMGLERLREVNLIRHAYVLPDFQRQGIGLGLLEYLKQINGNRTLMVGTWAAAWWAIDFYLKNGFEKLPNKDELLRKYWKIPERQVETSVVLGLRP